MKAIILARVSTEEQMNEGQSIPAQLARAQEYAKRKGNRRPESDLTPRTRWGSPIGTID